jgi:hypothetical protein
MRRTKSEFDMKSVSKLENIVKRGKRAVREVNRARIPLFSNSGKRNDETAETLCVNRNSVLGVKKRYLRVG